MDKKTQKRIARQRRVRAKVSGTSKRPRIAVFKSNKNLNAQVIDDVKAVTIVSVTTKKVDGKTFADKVKNAGVELAKLMTDKKIKEAVFDRGGNAYTGNVKAFADAVREGGIKF